MEIGGDEIEELNLGEFKAVCVVGRGAKGVVFLIRLPTSPLPLALKALPKSQSTRLPSEQRLLLSLSHPLLPKLHRLFQSHSLLGFAMDYCPGPTLRSLRKNQTEHVFSPSVIRFYAAELVLVLEYLHEQGIAYRDLKPDNVMIQESGHIMLVDFDLSKKLSSTPPPPNTTTDSVELAKPHGCMPGLFSHGRSWVTPEGEMEEGVERGSRYFCKTNSFVGTEEYMAPEMIMGKGHDMGVDCWSLGVVIYEMLHGVTPFRGGSRKETFYRILTKEAEMVGQANHLRDLIGKLLEKEAGKRVGLGEIKAHPFFEDVCWEEVLQICRPPFVPSIRKGNDGDCCDEGDDGIDVEVSVERLMMRKGEGGGVRRHEDELYSSDSF